MYLATEVYNVILPMFAPMTRECVNERFKNHMKVTQLEANRFSKKILTWFRVHGRHDLPWQKQQTPYRVWVSEIMLQQTQVKTVIDYYKRFMQRFPSIKQLAQADQDEVLHYWTGLGYYARARHLHQCAKQIVNDFNGRFPNQIEQVMALPGIGKSTAGAILSLARQQHHAILDGNVKRVLCRHWMIEGWPEKTTVKNSLWQLAECLTPKQDVASYNQAMMDLGATVCIRGQARCLECPVAQTCLANQHQQVSRFPFSKPKAKLPIKTTFMLIIKNGDNQVYLQKRPANGIWGGLWSLPECPLHENITHWCSRQLGMEVVDLAEQPALRHTFSHFHLDITPVTMQIKNYHLQIMEDKEALWYNKASDLKLGFATPVKRLIKHYQE